MVYGNYLYKAIIGVTVNVKDATNDGAYSGMHLTVYSVKTIAGRYVRKELGKLKITDVMGDDVSLCKETSGGKNIKAALDEEQTVVAVTTD